MRTLSATLFLASAILATASAAATPDTSTMPTGPRMIEHQVMKMGDKVIYQADIDMSDPARLQQYRLDIKVDNYHWDPLTADSNVGVIQHEDGGSQQSSRKGWTVSYVVTDVSPSGNARVELIYTIRDPEKGINKNEHIHANVELGKAFTTTSKSGSNVRILVTRADS